MTKKRILSAILTLCMIAGIVFGAQTSVSAASKVKVKVTFDGKAATFVFDSDKGWTNPKTWKELEKKWGKKTRLANEDEEWPGYAYVWEKGKSKIIIQQQASFDENNNVLEYYDGLGYCSAEVYDKNVTIAGVKVGMKKSAALKKLQKLYGKKNVKVEKGTGSILVEGKKDLIRLTSVYSLEFEFKNNKITGIYWMHS